MTLNNKVYDKLKWITMIFLPAVATLYFTVAKIWNLTPHAQEVLGTISAVEVFLGTLLGISTHNYAGEGTITIVDESNPDYDEYDLDTNLSSEELRKLGKVTFQVVNNG